MLRHLLATSSCLLPACLFVYLYVVHGGYHGQRWGCVTDNGCRLIKQALSLCSGTDADNPHRIYRMMFIYRQTRRGTLSTGYTGTKQHARPHCTRKQLHYHETYHYIHLLYPDTKHPVHQNCILRPSFTCITYMNIVPRNKTV